MKKLLIAAAVAALSAAATPVFAAERGDFSPTTFYVNAGYTAYNVSVGSDSATLSALGGRVGARFGKYLGVEGEGGFGVNTHNFSGVNAKIESEFAGYAIGFIPLSERGDLFARVGYGHETASGSGGGFSASAGGDSINFGGGAQYFFDDHNGVRAEYTRYQDTHSGGGGIDTFGVAYVRKF